MIYERRKDKKEITANNKLSNFVVINHYFWSIFDLFLIAFFTVPIFLNLYFDQVKVVAVKFQFFKKRALSVFYNTNLVTHEDLLFDPINHFDDQYKELFYLITSIHRLRISYLETLNSHYIHYIWSIK